MEKKEYRTLTIPKLAWNAKTLRDTYGELVAQPLEPGFGITLGNALRRILLGGVEGCAVTSIIIKGINNEFSSLQGVVEDAMQVVLNVKKIVIRNKTGKPGIMRARLEGEGTLRVMDIVADDHLELVNKDHVIAHVSAGGELDIEFFVENGRGYQPAQWPEGKPLQEDNRIHLDSMFSPVTKVSFDVEKTRVGGDIDYDKLTIHVHTDGSENPVDVMHYSTSVLRTQLQHFQASAEIPFNELSKHVEEDEVMQEEQVEDLRFKGVPVDLLMKPIEELELSVRANNCLLQSGIKRIIDLVNMPLDEVLKIKNFGRKSANEVQESLKTYGLTFGMDVKEEDLKKLVKNKDIE
jgi:DNA-directed RNA polymerase subunit alpha